MFFEPRLSKSGWISCNSCHNLSTGGADNLPSSIGHKWMFGPINAPTQKFGVVKPYDKDTQMLGRYNVTKHEKDKYVFKVPLLRNIELTAPYFHDESTWSLNEAVTIMAQCQQGITFTEDETSKIVAFLRTLTGDQPSIIFPILPPSTANTPKPDRN